MGTLPSTSSLVGFNSQNYPTLGANPTWFNNQFYALQKTLTSILAFLTSLVGSFAPSATTDTTNASNITSGTLAVARLPVATASADGIVKPDGSTITISSGVISAAVATASADGIVKPDGSTITIASGVISAAGGNLITKTSSVLTTSSSSGVMAGIAAKITPTKTGAVLLLGVGTVSSDPVNDYAFATIQYGTGTAPTSGAAITGTQADGRTVDTAGTYNSWVAMGAVTGLTLGTTYWVDLSLAIITASSSVTLNAGARVIAVEV